MIGERFSDIVEAIYESAVDQSHWSQTMELIAREVGGRGTLLGINARGASSFFSITGYDQSQIDSFTEHYASKSFVWSLLPGAAEGDLIHDRKVLPDDRRRFDVFANEWAPRSDTGDCIVMPLVKRPEISAVAVVARSMTTGDFNQSAITFLEKLMPHLRRAVTINNHLGHSGQQADFALDTIAQLPEPVVMVREDGTMTWCNRAALLLLEDKDAGIVLSRGRITCKYAHDRTALRDLITRTTGKQDGLDKTAGAILVERGSPHRPMAVYCLPLADPSRWTLERQPAALLLLSDMTRHIELPGAMLSRLFRLTTAEARLATCLSKGLSLSEAAVELNVARSTVASHLHMIFQKTQTRRQSDLVRLLHTLPRFGMMVGDDADQYSGLRDR